MNTSLVLALSLNFENSVNRCGVREGVWRGRSLGREQRREVEGGAGGVKCCVQFLLLFPKGEQNVVFPVGVSYVSRGHDTEREGRGSELRFCLQFMFGSCMGGGQCVSP